MLGGLLIAGVDAVDSREDPGWFAAQACAGPAVWAIDRVHQSFYHIADHPETGIQAIGRAKEIGTLYVACAGIMNLIAVLDAAFWRPRPSRRATDG